MIENNTSLNRKNKIVERYRLWADTIDAYEPRQEDLEIVKTAKTTIFKLCFRKYCGFDKIRTEIIDRRPEIQSGTREFNKLVDDMLYCKFCYGILTREYFKYSVDRLNHEGRKGLMATGRRYRVFTAFNGKFVLDKIDAKYDCYQTLKDFFGRECILISSENDKENMISFLNKHEVCFVKPNRESCGRGAVRLTIKDVLENGSVIDDLLEKFGELVIEENIRQNPIMSILHEQSVNTVRVMIIRLNNSPQMLFAGLRYGSGDNVVDNVGSGGSICMIDRETGIVKTSKNGNVCDETTGQKIIGFAVPEWEKLQQMVVDISDRLPEYRLFALDLALDVNNNWLLVEANSHAELGGDRIIKECGYDYEAFIKLAESNA